MTLAAAAQSRIGFDCFHMRVSFDCYPVRLQLQPDFDCLKF